MHLSPASSLWPLQKSIFPTPPWGQSISLRSVFLQRRSSIQMGPVPGPNAALYRGVDIDGWYPSWRQATFVSNVDHPPSQTVPHVSFMQSSTRPSSSVVPSTSLMSPYSQITGTDMIHILIFNNSLYVYTSSDSSVKVQNIYNLWCINSTSPLITIILILGLHLPLHLRPASSAWVQSAVWVS